MLHDLLTNSNLKAVSSFFSSSCLHLHLSTAFWTFLIFTVRFPQVILQLISLGFHEYLTLELRFYSLRNSVTFFDKGETATPTEPYVSHRQLLLSSPSQALATRQHSKVYKVPVLRLGYGLDDLGFDSDVDKIFFFSPKKSRPTMEDIQPTIQKLPRFFSPQGVHCPWQEINRSTPTHSEDKAGFKLV
jgi:hypothetical protein